MNAQTTAEASAITADPARFIADFANPPTPYTDKLVALAKSLRDDEEEDEAGYWHRQDLIAEARRADRESLDGSSE